MPLLPRSEFPRSFAERDRVVIAVVGIVVLTVVAVLTFNAAALPVVGGGERHTVELREAGGLRPGNEVRVAGVKVGEVTDVSLDGAVVEVDFRVAGVRLGDRTRAAVKVKTLLGQKFLAIEPAGRGALRGAIPASRTTVPYDVTQAFSDLSDNVGAIDTEQLEASFEALTTAFEDTPESVREMVDGLTSLSLTVSTRDEELAGLLEASSDVTATVADRSAEVEGIVTAGSALLDELERRRETVGAMLSGTARLGTQLRGLVADNEATLRPALARLDEVSEVLRRNQDHLDRALALLGPYYRTVTSALGNGRWIDVYACGLFDESQGFLRPELRADVTRNCDPRRSE